MIASGAREVNKSAGISHSTVRKVPHFQGFSGPRPMRTPPPFRRRGSFASRPPGPPGRRHIRARRGNWKSPEEPRAGRAWPATARIGGGKGMSPVFFTPPRGLTASDGCRRCPSSEQGARRATCGQPPRGQAVISDGCHQRESPGPRWRRRGKPHGGHPVPGLCPAHSSGAGGDGANRTAAIPFQALCPAHASGAAATGQTARRPSHSRRCAPRMHPALAAMRQTARRPSRSGRYTPRIPSGAGGSGLRAHAPASKQMTGEAHAVPPVILSFATS